MRAHGWIPGRKVLVLFTTHAFRGERQDLMQRYMEPLRQIARQDAFSVFAVDTSGIAPRDPFDAKEKRGGENIQNYFGMLAMETGGATVRGAAEMTRVFRQAEEQLACYYLVSLPVERDSRGRAVSRLLTVALDTDRRPELWRYRIRSPSRVTLLDRRERLRRERVAALLAPGEFGRPPVKAVLGFPVVEDAQDVLPARFRVPLSGLTWVPGGGGRYVARVLFDGTIHRDTGAGVDTLCSFGVESGASLELTRARPPAEDSRDALAIELTCPARKDGLHSARGVVTDLEGGHSGAGRSTVAFRRGGSPAWSASALRVEAASGLDYVWRPGLAVAKRDASRSAGRQVEADSPADARDRLYFGYVLCGPDRSRLGSAVRHEVRAREPGGSERTILVFPREKVVAAVAAAPTSKGPFCAPVRLRLDQFTLDPGSYVFTVSSSAGERIGEAPFAVR